MTEECRQIIKFLQIILCIAHNIIRSMQNILFVSRTSIQGHFSACFLNLLLEIQFRAHVFGVNLLSCRDERLFVSFQKPINQTDFSLMPIKTIDKCAERVLLTWFMLRRHVSLKQSSIFWIISCKAGYYIIHTFLWTGL